MRNYGWPFNWKCWFHSVKSLELEADENVEFTISFYLELGGQNQIASINSFCHVSWKAKISVKKKKSSSVWRFVRMHNGSYKTQQNFFLQALASKNRVIMLNCCQLISVISKENFKRNFYWWHLKRFNMFWHLFVGLICELQYKPSPTTLWS